MNKLHYIVVKEAQQWAVYTLDEGHHIVAVAVFKSFDAAADYAELPVSDRAWSMEDCEPVVD